MNSTLVYCIKSEEVISPSSGKPSDRRFLLTAEGANALVTHFGIAEAPRPGLLLPRIEALTRAVEATEGIKVSTAPGVAVFRKRVRDAISKTWRLHDRLTVIERKNDEAYDRLTRSYDKSLKALDARTEKDIKAAVRKFKVK